MLFAMNLTWTALLLKTVKSMLYLGYFLLHFVLICNLEVSLKFQLTFLQVNVIKMYTVRLNNGFFSYF